MSFENINPINQIKAQATYKDGGGLGGGGMYMRQGKRKKEEDEDIFEYSEDKNDNEITIDSEMDEKDIPVDTLFNKFVNWFRIGKD